MGDRRGERDGNHIAGLELMGAPCHGSGMEKPPSDFRLGGGALLAAAILLGAIVGILAGEPSIGVLAGFAVGIVAAVLIWLWDRSRRR